MNTLKEDSKTISMPGKSTQENKKVIHVKQDDKEEEDDETEDQQEGELCDSPDGEVEYDDVDNDSDEEDEYQSETSVKQNAINNKGQRAKKSNCHGKALFRNAERGRSDGRRARNSAFNVTAPSKNDERGRSDRRRARKSDRVGRQHSGKSGDTVSLKTSRGGQTHLRHNIHQISRARSNFSQSKGRSLPEKKASA
ncbi:hypothetical protein ACFX10_034113 [Malus domestica]